MGAREFTITLTENEILVLLNDYADVGEEPA